MASENTYQALKVLWQLPDRFCKSKWDWRDRDMVASPLKANWISEGQCHCGLIKNSHWQMGIKSNSSWDIVLYYATMAWYAETIIRRVKVLHDDKREASRPLAF